jgi:protein involved in polysaccharide export with SLBB domain
MKLEMFDRSAMRNLLPFGRGISLIRALVLSVLALSSFSLCSGTVLAQSSNPGASGNSVAGDRGEQEAEQIVALSPDKIIELLRAEPGLLLEVKKLLVREAFAQGRLLTPADLEDEALFRLLWEDEHVRVLATREIERRKYVRAMPTEAEEQAQEKLDWQAGRVGRAGWSSQPQAAGAEQGTTRGDTLGRQEEIYWEKHEQSRPAEGTADPGTSPMLLPAPNPTDPEMPRNSWPENPARILEQTTYPDNSAPNGSFPDSSKVQFNESDIDANNLERIGPGQTTEGVSENSRPAGTTNGGGRSNSAFQEGNPSGDVGTPSGSVATAGNFMHVPLADDLQPQRSRQITDTRQRLLPASGWDFRSNSYFNQDRPVIRHRPNPYANVPSLYDLYTQVAGRSPVLARFGMDVFLNRNGNLNALPMDLPVGPDYVLGPGDGLNIQLSGSVAQRLARVVDPEGKVALPEVGAIEVSGRNLGDAQHLLQATLRTQFHDVQADVALGRIRTVRVYVVGDVASPGAYDISSLSTVLNALYAAGGPTARGSLRHLRQYRGKILVQEIDAYDLLLHGIHSEPSRLQAGDTLLVPPIGAEVMVEGMVQRPAIYELDGEKSLAEVLELAGGVLSSGSLRHIDVERTVAHQSRTMLRLDLPESNDQLAVNLALEQFAVQDGDKIKISPILPYAEQTVYLDGHVFHPGKYPYKDGMKVTDILHSDGDLMPEPSNHAEIIRLQAPNYTPVVLAFPLDETMAGKDLPLVLKPFDTVRVFSRYDFEDPPVITVSGEVRFPGDHLTNGATRLRDAVYLAGGVSSDAELEDAQVFRKLPDGKLKVMSVNLAKALAGDPVDDVLLQPKDRLFIHRDQTKVDPPTVRIEGEVARPGRYPMGEGMTASQLVRLAGGLKRSADPQRADLARYLKSNLRQTGLDAHGEQDGNNLGETHPVEIALALAGDATADVGLIDGDVLTVRQRQSWNDLGSVVTVKGEVLHPGSYGIRDGERLSSVLSRAGGFGPDACPYGAMLERVQIRQLEEKNRVDLIRHVAAEGPGLQLIPEGDEDQKMAKQAALLQWQSALDKLQNTPPSGRLVVHISGDVARWANTPADITVRNGDLLFVPKTPNFVMVDGAVYNPTAVAFRSGRSAGWYLRQAGGPTNVAEKKAIFLVRADGSVVGGGGGLWSGGVLAAELRPGDMLVVPERAYSGTTRWKSTLQSAQLVSAVGIAVQVARGF